MPSQHCHGQVAHTRSYDVVLSSTGGQQRPPEWVGCFVHFFILWGSLLCRLSCLGRVTSLASGIIVDEHGVAHYADWNAS